MFGATSGGTGLFSNSNSTGLFGANSSSQPGLGSSTAPKATGFGTSSTSGFGNTTSQQGGLFGASNTSAATNTLGSTNQSTGGLFGKPAVAPAPSGGLFGSTTTTNTNLGGLFGASNTANAPASQNTQAGGLFGKPAAPAASGGLFGSSNASSNTQLTGLFGNKPATGGLFGSTTANPSNLSLGTTSATNNRPGGLFGNSSNNTGIGGGIGQNVSSSTGFGAPATAPAAQPTSGSGLFSNNTNSAQPSFAWSSQQTTNLPASQLNLQLAQAPAKAQQNSSTYTPAINDQLIKLKEQWDPSSPKCVLKTHLYNKFTEQEMAVLMQQPRPSNETPEDWDHAMSNRPGPLYYPVKVTSFSEVAQRIEVQLDHVAKGRILLNNINDELTQLLSKHDLDNTTRIMKAKVRHTKFARRLLRLATILAILKLKGYPLLPEEEEISRQFQALNAKITDPNAPVGKLSDLYARLAILKGRSEELSHQLESSIQNMNGGLKSVINDSRDVTGQGNTQLDQIVSLLTKLLYKQQVGLSYLNEILQKDLAAVDEATTKH